MANPFIDFRVRVPLDRFDLDVEIVSDKRVIGVWGHSGSGKTTFLEAIAGLRRRARGYLRCGDNVWQDDLKGIRLPTEKRHLGFVPQDHLLFPHLNVRQNLFYGTRRKSGGNSSDHEEIVDVLKLKLLLSRSIQTLSGGEKQRVSLGRALFSNPQMLILDEPLSSLDMALRYQILPYLLRIKERFDVPILIVSHNPIELQAICDEIIAIDSGKVIDQGDPGAVFTNPKIYKFASEEGFQNVVHGWVTEERTHTYLVNLDVKNSVPAKLSVLKTEDLPPSDKVLMGIPANEILVSMNRLSGVSARNQLTGQIASIRNAGHRYLVSVLIENSGEQLLTVELTQDAVDELKLKSGIVINLAIKSSSVTLYG